MQRLYKDLTPTEKEEIKAEQKGTCAICFRDTEPLVIDHDHETGYVRQGLCMRCNLGLGAFEDDWDMLLRALCYVAVHKAGLTDIRIGFRILVEDAKKRVNKWDESLAKEANRQLCKAKQGQQSLVAAVEDILTVERAALGISTLKGSGPSKSE